MNDPLTVLTTAIEATSKVTNNPTFMTAIDKLTGYKLSQWNAEGDVVQKQIKDGYEEAKEKGLGLQYASAFRSSANLLNTVSKVTEHIDATVEREVALEEDVFWNLLEHAKTISDEDVQDFIARIIAGEYNQKGSYSMTTIQTLKYMGKEEIDSLSRVGSLMLEGGQIPVNVFYLAEDFGKLMESVGTSYIEFQSLQNLGLFYGKDITTQIDSSAYKALSVRYFEKGLIFLQEENAPKNIKMPSYYGLSAVGKQLMAHLDLKKSDFYAKWLETNYTIPHYKLEKVIDFPASNNK